MITTLYNILFSTSKDTNILSDCCVRLRISASMLWCSLRLRRLVVHIWSSVTLTSFHPHFQQTLLEITGRRYCASRASRWLAPMIFTPGSTRTKCERPCKRRNCGSGSEDHASASALACEQKEDISNIFLN